MNSTTLQYIRSHIKANEGTYAHPYLDSKGLITVGTGFNVDDRDNFNGLPWQVTNPDGTTRPATPAEIDRGYGTMSALKDGPAGRAAAAFAGSTTLSLPQSVIDAQLDRKIQAHADDVVNTIGADAWNNLTDGQRAVMTDVDYAKGGLDTFPNLIGAAKSQDAVGIASESPFHSGNTAAGLPRYNWDRVARNTAAALGVPFQTGQWLTARQFPDRPDLPGTYKAMLAGPKLPDGTQGDGIGGAGGADQLASAGGTATFAGQAANTGADTTVSAAPPSPNPSSVPPVPDGGQSKAADGANPDTDGSGHAGTGAESSGAPSLSPDDPANDDGTLSDQDVAELTPNFAPDQMVMNDLDLGQDVA